MNPEEQRAYMREYLERTEEIVSNTRAKIREERAKQHEHPLRAISPEIQREVEEEFYTALGRQPYMTSRGQKIWLTENELKNRKRTSKSKKRSQYYSAYTQDRRKLKLLAFNIGAVLLAIMLSWLMVR